MNAWTLLWVNLAIRFGEWRARRRGYLLGDTLVDQIDAQWAGRRRKRGRDGE